MGYLKTFTQLSGNYGLSGLITFVKLKIGFTRNIRLNKIQHKIRLRPNSSDVTTFKHIFAHGDYELSLDYQPKVIIDAGANVGLAAVFFANKFPDAKIIAIELSPANFQLLVENTNHYHNIKTINAGLWHRHQVLKFKEEGFSAWGYKVNNALEGSGISVNSITISDIIKQYDIKIIDLLKVDIEGAEVEVFSENFKEWLPLVRYLVIEFHDRSRPGSSATVKAALAKFNFNELEMVGENAVYLNNDLVNASKTDS